MLFLFLIKVCWKLNFILETKLLQELSPWTTFGSGIAMKYYAIHI